MNVQQCPFCTYIESEGVLFCSRCGRSMSSDASTARDGNKTCKSNSDDRLSSAQIPPLQKWPDHNEHTYETFNSYQDNGKRRLSQHPTGSFTQNKARDDEGEERILPVLPGSPGARQASAVSGTPRMGMAPATLDTPDIAPDPLLNRRLPISNPPSSMKLRRAAALQHASVRRSRHSTVRMGAIIVAGVAAAIIAGLLIAHAVKPLSSGPLQIKPSPRPFHPAMSVTGTPGAGKQITVHGSSFPASKPVTFLLDGQQLVDTSSHTQTPLTARKLSETPPISVSSQARTMMLSLAATEPTMVQADGTFTATITLPANWKAGPHTILASVPGDQSTVQVELIIDISVTPVSAGSPIPTWCLALSSNQLSYTGVTGKSDPAAQSVVLFNCGTKGQWTASIATDDGAAWLNASQTSGVLATGASQAISVIASNTRTKLSANTYMGHITFSLGANATTIDVTLTVANNPCIQVSPSSLTFSGVAGTSDPVAQTATISNCGDNEAWSVSVTTNDGTGWLSVSPTSGTLHAGDSTAIIFTAPNLNAGLPGGSYSGQVIFAVGKKAATVNVKLTVTNPPCIQASPQTLAFSGVAGVSDPSVAQKVTIANCGDSGTWTASPTTNSGGNWLAAGANGSATGQINASATQDVAVTVDSQNTQLTAGSYTGTITLALQSSEGTRSVTVSVTFVVYAPPCIKITQADGQTPANTLSASLAYASVTGQSDPAAQTVTIANCGEKGTWSEKITFDNGSGWLAASANGSTSGQIDASGTQDIGIVVDSQHAQLTAGTYTGHLTLTITSKAGSSSVTINVTLTVTQSQCLKLSTKSLTFYGTVGGANPASQTVTLTNCGSVGDWTASTDSGAGWLGVKPGSGTLPAGASGTVSVSISTSALSAATYTTTIVFSLGSDSHSVQVTVKMKTGSSTTSQEGGSQPAALDPFYYRD